MSAACPEYAFQVELLPVSDDVTPAWGVALRNMLESRGLSVGHEYHLHRRLIVVRDGGQAVEADRVALMEWAAEHTGYGSVRVGPIIDLLELT